IPVLYDISGFSLRVHDIILCIMVVMLLTEARMNGKLRMPRELRHIFIPVLVFVAYIGFTLLNIYISLPEFFPVSAASLLRLAQYIFLIPLTCLMLKKEQDLADFVKSFVFICSSSIAIALV